MSDGLATSVARVERSETPAILVPARYRPVYRDGSARISWTSRNTASCTVTSANGDSWTGLTGTNKQSLPITQRTTFNLRCEGLPNADPPFVERSVTVNIAPMFEEK